jgi:hypothetical protein
MISVWSVDPLGHIFCELARRLRRLHHEAAVGHVGRELLQRAADALFQIVPIERRPAQQPVNVDPPVWRLLPYDDRIEGAASRALLRAVIQARRVFSQISRNSSYGCTLQASAELNPIVIAVSIGDRALRAKRSVCSGDRALSGLRHIPLVN